MKGPQSHRLCPHHLPLICFPILFLFFQVEMTNSFQRTLVENNLCPLHSWPEPVQEMQVIYQSLFTGTEDGFPAQLRGSSLLLFPLLFHSSLFMRVSKFPFKGYSHVAVKLLIPVISNKVLCPFQCKFLPASLFPYISPRSQPASSITHNHSFELNAAENHMNCGDEMNSVHTINLKSSPKSITHHTLHISVVTRISQS